MIRTLCGEPFCWPLSEARKVTDHWFHEMIVLPAVERARKRSGGRRGGRGHRPATLKRLPTREEYVAGGVLLGGNAEEMGRAYDAWRATQPGGGDGSE